MVAWELEHFSRKILLADSRERERERDVQRRKFQILNRQNFTLARFSMESRYRRASLSRRISGNSVEETFERMRKNLCSNVGRVFKKCSQIDTASRGKLLKP
jgi:hypothetical protein